MPISINLPTVKRIPGDFDQFQDAFEAVGYEQVSSAAGGRIHYHENAIGMGITLVDGPRANIAMPSGPIRGGFFTPSTTGFGSGSPIENAISQVENEMSGESEDNTRGSTGETEFTV